MLNCTFRPIVTWPRTPTKLRRNSQFKASYPQTLRQLEKELNALHAKNIVIQLAIQPGDLRQDGFLISFCVEHFQASETMQAGVINEFRKWREAHRAQQETQEEE